MRYSSAALFPEKTGVGGGDSYDACHPEHGSDPAAGEHVAHLRRCRPVAGEAHPEHGSGLHVLYEQGQGDCRQDAGQHGPFHVDAHHGQDEDHHRRQDADGVNRKLGSEDGEKVRHFPGGPRQKTQYAVDDTGNGEGHCCRSHHVVYVICHLSAGNVRHQKRAGRYRCKTVWDTGALVSWSSDDIVFDDFNKSPYLGMEVGMTRMTSEKTLAPERNITDEPFLPLSERMSMEEMIIGYTISGAEQLGIEDRKGSIEPGKDADSLVFENNLLTAEQEGFSHHLPQEVYFGGKKVNSR